MARQRQRIWARLLSAGFAAAVAIAVAHAEVCAAAGDAAVAAVLDPIRRKHGVPAISAAIVTSEGLDAVGAVGVRKAGTDVPVTLDDTWHLGSETKAMTAVLVARLVEAKRLTWQATLWELFPDLAPRMHPLMRDVTLKHLLSHRAGLPANLEWGKIAQEGGTVREQRQRVLVKLLSAEPLTKPGEAYAYSNAGYVLVGAVLERLFDQSWEDMIRTQVFEPLGMESVGFGGTGTPGKLDQPWGHTDKDSPVPRNGPDADNPPVLGPAGRVHCTIRDWARFVSDQLRGARGKKALLSPESYRVLHTPPFGGEYALGWVVVQRGWGGGTVLHHTGCNTMNYANVWIAPKKDFAVLVCINEGDTVAFKATDECAGALIRLYPSRKQGTP